VATWTEVENYLTSNYKTEKKDNSIIQLVFNVGNGRSQLVFVEGHSLDHDDAFITFVSPFAKVDQLTPQEVVTVMSIEGNLGVTIFAGYYVLTNAAPLKNLDTNEIAWPLFYVTEFADIVERALGLGDDL